MTSAPRPRGAGIGPELARLGLEVEEALRHLHPADAVGERVVHLHDERGATAFEAVDDRELPERPLPVESGHAALARVLEHVGQLPGRGCRDPPDVEAELEGVVLDPARVREAHRRLHDLAAGTRGRAATHVRCGPQTRSMSGLPSSTTTLTTVERRRGSASMYQENASVSRMYGLSRTVMADHLSNHINLIVRRRRACG